MSFVSGQVISPAKNGTLGSQAGASTSQIIFDTTLLAVNNGDISGGEAGHDTFVGRKVILRRGLSTEEDRLITKVEVDNLTCTVHEAWTVIPALGDAYDVAYILFDGYGPVRPGAHFFDLNQRLIVGDTIAFTYFSLVEGYGLGSKDQGSTVISDIQVRSLGRFDVGVQGGGKSISGGQVKLQTGEGPQVDGQLGLEVESGGELNLENTFVQASRDVMIHYLSGATGVNKSVAFFSAYTMQLIGGASLSFDTFSVEGRRSVNDTIELSGVATYINMSMISCESLINSTAGVETITIRGYLSVGNTKEIVISADKTWLVIDPTWTPLAANLDFGAGNTGEVQEKFSLDIAVKNPAGTALANARTYIDDETNNLLPAENKIGTDANGKAVSDIKKRRFTFPAAGAFTTETFGAFVLRVLLYSKTPFETSLGAVTTKQVLGITLIDDAGITLSEVNADAVVGVVASKPTNPDSVISYDGGTGTFTVGQVITGATSGAIGTLSEDTGDQVTGKFLLTARNATSFQDNEALSDPVTGAAVSNLLSPEQRFAWEIDCNNKSLSDVFHNLDSRAAKASPAAIFLTMLLTRTRLLDRTGSNFSTATISSEGVLLVNRGVGTVTGMGDNAGGSFVPPTSVTFLINSVISGTQVYISATPGGPLADKAIIFGPVLEGTTTFSRAFTFSGNQPFRGMLALGTSAPFYKPFPFTGTITSTGFTITASQQLDQ